MVILMEELCMMLILWVLRLNDAIMEMFEALTGISKVMTEEGESGTMLSIVFGSSAINTIFWGVVVLAVGLLAFFTIIAVIRNMIKSDKRISGIVGKMLIAVVGTIAVMMIVMICMAMVDELVVLVADILQLDTSQKFSTILFDCFARDAWNSGVTAADFDCTMKVKDVMGDYKAFLGFFPTAWKEDSGLIDGDEFFYLPALIGTCVTSVYLLIATVNLGKRVFEMVYVYLCMPAAMSVLPLDDGARFQNWTQSFVARMVIVFGSILSVNVFALVIPIVTSMYIPGLGNFGNCVFMIILMCSGAALIPTGGRLFERIFVSREEAFFDGSSGGLALAGRMIAKGGKMAVGLGVKAGKATLGSAKNMVGAGAQTLKSAYTERHGGGGYEGGGGFDSGYGGGSSGRYYEGDREKATSAVGGGGDTLALGDGSSYTMDDGTEFHQY